MYSCVRWQNHTEIDPMLKASAKADIGAIAAKAHFVPKVGI